MNHLSHSDSSAALLIHVLIISRSRLPSISQKCQLPLPEKQCGILWRHVLSQPRSRSQRGDHSSVATLPGCVCRKITSVHCCFFFSQYGNSLAMAGSLSQSLAQNLGIQWDPAAKKSMHETHSHYYKWLDV